MYTILSSPDHIHLDSFYCSSAPYLCLYCPRNVRLVLRWTAEPDYQTTNVCASQAPCTRRKPCSRPRCAGTRTLRPATTEHVQADPYWLHSPRPGHWCVVAQSPNQNTASRLPCMYLATYSILRAHIDSPCDPVLYYRRGKETGGGCSTRPPELSAITTSNFLLLTISLLRRNQRRYVYMYTHFWSQTNLLPRQSQSQTCAAPVLPAQVPLWSLPHSYRTSPTALLGAPLVLYRQKV